MTPEQVIASLQQQYANVQPFNPMNPYGPGWGEGGAPEFMRGEYTSGDLTGFTPNNNGGYSGPLTPNFDPSYEGGKYGQYRGTFSADGTLDPASVVFSPEERSGSFVSENMLPLTLAVMGGVGGANWLGYIGSGSGAAPAVGGAGGFSGAASGAGAAGTGITEALGAGTGFSGAAGAGLAGGGVDLAGLGLGGTGTFGELTGATMLTGGGVAPALTTGAGGVTAGLGAAGAAAGGGGAGSVLGSIVDGLGGTKGIATGLGALAGLAGSGDKTSTSETSVPAWLQPYGQDLVQRGQDYAQQGFQNFGGQRFAGPNQAQQNAWEMVNQAANNPTSQQGQAETAYQSLLSGNTPTYANGAQVNNQYIGQTTPGASNQYIGQQTGSNVLGLAQGNVNPYLDKQTQQIGPLGQMNLAQSTTNVGKNALLGMNNPYLQNSIDASVGDITRNFNNTINPQLDRMARASGSFGNSGVEQARQEAGRTLASQIGRTSNDMRMTDYALQAQLGEGDVNRQVNTSLADATRNLGASKDMQTFNIGNDFQRQALNAGYNAGDITRNLSGYNTQQGNVLNAGMYDTTSRQNDLGRNSTLTQGMNQFNSTLGQNDLGRNTQYMGQQQLFNANQGNFDILNGLNTWNNSQNRIASTLPQWQGFAEQPYRAANAMGTVGQQMNNYAQQPLDFQFQEFMRQQADPASRLGVYGTAYNTARGGNQVNTQQTGSNPAAGLIGGAASGMGLYNLFTNQRY
jgi:hypothetical protein